MEVTFKAYDMLHVWKLGTAVSGNLVFKEIMRIASTAIILDVKTNEFTRIRSHKDSRLRPALFKSLRCNDRYTRREQKALTKHVGKPSIIRFKMPRAIQTLASAN